MTVDRRMVLAGGLALGLLPGVARAALPIPPNGRLGFDVMRKGSKLGEHVLTFARAGDALTVQVVVDLVYKFGPFTLYRYHHRATERWLGDRVIAIVSQTDDNGTACKVSGVRTAAGLVVEGSKAPRYVAPADALPATHWNRRELDGPWINTQDGRLMRPKIAPLGVAAIPTAGGATIRANRFQLTGDVALDIFYDATPGWAGLTFTASDGSLIRYERQ